MNNKLNELLKKAKADPKSITPDEKLLIRCSHGIRQAAMQSAMTLYGKAIKEHHTRKSKESHWDMVDKRTRFNILRR